MPLITKVIMPEKLTSTTLTELALESFRVIPTGNTLDVMQYVLDQLVERGILGE